MVSVKKAKLSMMPSVIPGGLLLPPDEEEDNMIGKRGHIQGANIVISPERNVNKSRLPYNVF